MNESKLKRTAVLHWTTRHPAARYRLSFFRFFLIRTPYRRQQQQQLNLSLFFKKQEKRYWFQVNRTNNRLRLLLLRVSSVVKTLWLIYCCEQVEKQNSLTHSLSQLNHQINQEWRSFRIVKLVSLALTIRTAFCWPTTILLQHRRHLPGCLIRVAAAAPVAAVALPAATTARLFWAESWQVRINQSCCSFFIQSIDGCFANQFAIAQ